MNGPTLAYLALAIIAALALTLLLDYRPAPRRRGRLACLDCGTELRQSDPECPACFTVMSAPNVLA